MKLTVQILVALLLGACGTTEESNEEVFAKIDQYESALDSSQKHLVFSIADHGGTPIDGKLRINADSVTDHLGIPLMEIPSVQNLITALELCDETIFLVQTGLHEQTVAVATKKNNQFRKQSDLELAECVQNRVAFSFGVGIGRGSDIDRNPFRSLHAQKN